MNEDFKEITDNPEYLTAYWEGSSNRFVRYWTYLRGGIGLLNESKNYILLVFGSYWTVKTSDIWLNYKFPDSWLLIAFLIGMPVGLLVLLLLGHWQLYRASKPQEYINAQHGSITGFRPYNIQVRQLKLLEEILKQIQNGK